MHTPATGGVECCEKGCGVEGEGRKGGWTGKGGMDVRKEKRERRERKERRKPFINHLLR